MQPHRGQWCRAHPEPAHARAGAGVDGARPRVSATASWDTWRWVLNRLVARPVSAIDVVAFAAVWIDANTMPTDGPRTRENTAIVERGW